MTSNSFKCLELSPKSREIKTSSINKRDYIELICIACCHSLSANNSHLHHCSVNRGILVRKFMTLNTAEITSVFSSKIAIGQLMFGSDDKTHGGNAM